MAQYWHLHSLKRLKTEGFLFSYKRKFPLKFIQLVFSHLHGTFVCKSIIDKGVSKFGQLNYFPNEHCQTFVQIKESVCLFTIIMFNSMYKHIYISSLIPKPQNNNKPDESKFEPVGFVAPFQLQTISRLVFKLSPCLHLNFWQQSVNLTMRICCKVFTF